MFQDRKNQYHILKCEKVIFFFLNLGSTGALKILWSMIHIRVLWMTERKKTEMTQHGVIGLHSALLFRPYLVNVSHFFLVRDNKEYKLKTN